jgi:hypothetical protein
MSSRFHNKYHRHNHHTASTEDPRYPDSGHDPIASYDSPFLGDFILNGTLSAVASLENSQTNSPAGVFVASPSGTPIALQVNGESLLLGQLSATNLELTNGTVNGYPFASPELSATPLEDFVELVINGTRYGIQLWSLPQA